MFAATRNGSPALFPPIYLCLFLGYFSREAVALTLLHNPLKYVFNILPLSSDSRTKHVSFARSLTLASFDDAIGMRPGNRMLNARSQERLIGGKKPTITITQQPPHLQQLQQIPMPMPIMQMQMPTILQKPQLQQTLSQPHPTMLMSQQSFEAHIKRNVMKTQATQTEVCLGRKPNAQPTLSLSPRTVHRVSLLSFNYSSRLFIAALNLATLLIKIWWRENFGCNRNSN